MPIPLISSNRKTSIQTSLAFLFVRLLDSEPEQLLGEVLSNRKLFLAQIRDSRSVAKSADWGMNERLKAQVDEQGFGLSLTKMNYISVPVD